MEPRIQYAQTADGVSIAFWTLGEGPAFVHMPAPFTHVQMEWQFPEMRRWYERLAEKRKVVRYDTRGCGLSKRELSEAPPEFFLLDLDAVVDRAGLEHFALWGYEHTGPVAIAYAARYPERVSHLLLWHSYARASDWTRSPQIQATRAVIDKDWDTYTETNAHVSFGWSEGERARRFAELIRESVTPQVLMLGLRVLNEVDVTAFLPQVTCPTLVLHRRQVSFPTVDIARDLASRIPSARLALLEGTARAPYLGDMEAVATAIDEFLGEGEEAPAARGAPSREPGGLVTILFTDVEGSTALTERVGDAKAREVLRAHERIVREALRSHGGSEIKHTGDGIMASFPSATWAVEAAIAMQRAFAEYNETAEEPIKMCIGLNAGEPIAEEKDLFGTAVNMAARIAAKAEGGEILASDVVRQLVAGKGFLFSDRGEVELKGFEEPVRLYEVRWKD
jgi:class 3 adenylate cyclase